MDRDIAAIQSSGEDLPKVLGACWVGRVGQVVKISKSRQELRLHVAGSGNLLQVMWCGPRELLISRARG